MSTKSYHLCVNIDVAIKRLRMGINIFDCTVPEAMTALMEAKSKGHQFYTGTCERQDATGRCMGHEGKRK